METIAMPRPQVLFDGCRQAQGNWNAAFSPKPTANCSPPWTQIPNYAPFFHRRWRHALSGFNHQPARRKDGKWPDYGQIHLVKISDAG